MAASMCAPLRRGPHPHPPTGGDNEAIKAKELDARRQVALVVSPAEATTSALGSLTSGSDYLGFGRLISRGNHLCNGQPRQRRRPPQHRRQRPPPCRRLASDGDHHSACVVLKRPSPLPSYGGKDKTIQERGCHLHGVRRLVQPPGRRRSSVVGGARDAMDTVDLRTVRPSPVRWTDSHAPLGGGRQRWRRHQSHLSQGARHVAADGACSWPAPRSRGSPPPQG
jgi:hypothetical protein